MVMEHYIGAVGRIGSKESFTKPAANRDHQRGQNDHNVSQHAERGNARPFAYESSDDVEPLRFLAAVPPGRLSPSA